MNERPPVSLSQAGHCRMELYLAAHGYKPEEHQPTTLRTFDMGHLVEAAMFDGITLADQVIGPWWPTLGVIRDPVRGVDMDTSEWTVTDRQKEVELHGYVGHIDGLLRSKDGQTVLLPDVKSASGFSFDRALKSDLMESEFSREYCLQLHAYRAGLRLAGVDVSGMVLLYFNKEQSQIMFRVIDYVESVDAEIEERLSWAKSTAEPTPDWEWQPGVKIPLRCSYCSQKQNCAAVRGVTLEQAFLKGKPVWAPRKVA